MDSQGPTAEPGSLKQIEKEGDAARVALARKLARKAMVQPAALSQAELMRIGNAGLPHFLDELHKQWGTMVDTAPSGTGAEPARKETELAKPPSLGVPAAQTAPVEQSIAVPQAPRPPLETEGWTDLCFSEWQPATGGVVIGIITGLVVIAVFALAIYAGPF